MSRYAFEDYTQVRHVTTKAAVPPTRAVPVRGRERRW
jgi:hypothetical protein